MLLELRVTNLGVIADQTVLLGSGLTALTGETGAGKTLLVDAISLLTGAPADPSLVAPGAVEARVEGRFVTPTGPGAPPGPTAPSAPTGPTAPSAPTGPVGPKGPGPSLDEASDGRLEVVLTRVVPASGRSRCYADGQMVSAARLAEMGRALVDIHGQNAHQSLLSPAAQRDALDRGGHIDTSEVRSLRGRIRRLEQERDALGGDPRERARQLDLLTYQLEEIDRAGLGDPDEDAHLQREEELLADAAGVSDAARAAWEALAGDGGAIDSLGLALSATAARHPLKVLRDRLSGLQDELSEVAGEARHMAESVESDPGRLAAIGERRRVLTELRRKYGGSLAEVLAYGAVLRDQVDQLASHDRRAAELDAELARARTELAGASTRLRDERRRAASRLGAAVEKELRALAMPRARFSIEVGDDDAGESVTWMLAANPGQPLLPLARVASGGELSRAMLAARLVVGPATARPSEQGGDDPETLIFDEVDAGIGGEAAVAVGQALAALGAGHQVLVVTHLAQVAAFATSHLAVTKDVIGSSRATRTVATARAVAGEERVVELARMLSGRPDSASARQHAAELLAGAAPRPQPSPTRARARR
ncbi:MAG: DNA repair protein RecN [Acidobacteriota bacterium]|nr:DNA repair protein RecN [Acidobacteriota bacterium]